MSTTNQINVTIPAETIATVLTNLQECKTLLAPYLQALTAKERHDILKMGDKTVATVLKTKDYIETNPQFIPGYMVIDDFMSDATVVEQLNPVTNLALQLSRDMEDTIMLAGSEAFEGALLYYGQVREAASKGIPSAEPIYNDLKQRFLKRRNKPEPTTPV